MDTHKLFKGSISIGKAKENRASHQLSKAFANHVSAKGLSSHDVPTLLHHNRLSPKDKNIWDEAYREEYLEIYRHGLPQLSQSTIK